MHFPPLGLKTAVLILAASSMSVLAACSHHSEAVTTYHYDNLRTGWNSHETKLTPAKVSGPDFGLLHSLTLDDEVDAQPLLVPDVDIKGGSWPGKHDVVYVATEGDTVYAIDARNGAVLLSPNFGLPVQMPQTCGNNGPNVGINGTPVIDRASDTLYVIIYTLEAAGPIYRIHALDLRTLIDKVPPVEVKATAGGYNFKAAWQRQRPGLVLANGNVYAAFGSFCDFGGTDSRGWLLGWQAGTLTPLAASQLNDLAATAPNNAAHRFLASVWMSGYGVAADAAGSLYFVTGNSDSNYNNPNSIQESVVQESPDLTSVKQLFTPANQVGLDAADEDYGSGGAMLLPDQPGSTPHLAAAAGKDGRMFILNRDPGTMGGYNGPGGPDKVIGMVNIGGCWCGQSYFVGSDGVGRIVGSGGSTVTVWKIQTSPSVSLISESSSPSIGGTQDPGFFTSISSHGHDESIIWALSRPNDALPANITLYAFKAESGGATLTTLFQATAGAWPSFNGLLGRNSNLVPVVANGRVYVASYKQLTIFGLH
jgi:hypothetical protein